MNYKQIEDILNYSFSDKSLLITAFTHSSSANENNTISYENMEFLGDSILSFVVSKYLYNSYKLSEGELSKIRAKLVSSATLSGIIKNLKLNQYIMFGKSIKNATDNILGDIYESIVASIFLDGGINCAEQFIKLTLIKDIDNINNIVSTTADYKTILQELIQKTEHKNIEYEVVKTIGMPHNLTFKMCLKIDGKRIAEIEGKSKKEAEQNLAKNTIKKLF